MSPADSAVVWVGQEDGRVFQTANGTSGAPAWQRCDSIGAKPLVAARYCTCIAPHPGDPLVAYVSFGGFVKENLWVTKDGGKTWALLGAALLEPGQAGEQDRRREGTSQGDPAFEASVPPSGDARRALRNSAARRG